MILTTSILKSNYSKYVNPLDKIKRDVDERKLFRLTRGLYETNSDTNPIFLAGSILSPSYISFEFALSFYGLIPEKVVAITSASLEIRKNKTFVNIFGRFEYTDIPSRAFSCGLSLIENDGYFAKIACKEKALCDSLYKWRVTKSIKELKKLLFEDKRIDEEEFASLDFNELIRLASLYNRSNLELLIKLIRKEYLHE
ncbi:MAG: hypothetical protein IJ186_00695 [Bacilli bacterium]|nr:hypothetical protein [Bacilli bacterium]